MKPVMKTPPFAAPLVTALMAMIISVAVTVTPALAQTTDRDPPDYVFEKDGTVVIDGDVATDCPSFATFVPNADRDPDLEQAQSVLEQCEEAGLLGSRDSTPSTPPSASASSGVSAVDGVGGGLPETGGPAPLALLGVAIIVVAASGLIARKVAG